MPQHDSTKAVVDRLRATNPATFIGKNYLFVIAIDDYLNCPSLYNCVRDAEQLIEVLIEKYYFEEDQVYSLYNEAATERNIFKTFRDLAAKISNQDNLIIFFSGHGEYDRVIEEGYWIPIDAQLGAQEDYIANSKIKTFLNAIHSLHTFLIVDSCFSGSLFTQFKSAALAERLEKDPSRWGLTAGRNEIVSDGKAGQHSPFADMLLYQLRQAEQAIGVAEICNRVIENVVANAEQTPRGEPLKIKGHRGGQFFFHPRNAIRTTPVVSSSTSTRSRSKNIKPVSNQRTDSKLFLAIGFLVLTLFGGLIYLFSGKEPTTSPITTLEKPIEVEPTIKQAEKPLKTSVKDLASKQERTVHKPTNTQTKVNSVKAKQPPSTPRTTSIPHQQRTVPIQQAPQKEAVKKDLKETSTQPIQNPPQPPIVPKIRKQSYQGKYGLKDLNSGQWVLAPEYKNITAFSGGLAAVQDFNYKWGYINEKGHIVIPFLIDQPSKFAAANQIKVMINAQWVVIDKQGRVPVGNRLVKLAEYLE